MTTLIAVAARSMPVVDVAGTAWPVNKLGALVAAFVGVLSVIVAGGPATTAAWIGAVLALAVWWGGYAVVGRRWNDGDREYHAGDHRIER